MLKSIQKFLNPKEVEMAKEDTQAAVPAVNTAAELTEAQATLAAQAEALMAATSQLATAQEQIAELTSKFEAAQAALNVIEDAKAKLIADAKAVQLAARKEKVELAIGTDKAAGILAATTDLSDAQFNAVVDAMATSFEAEANSPMFVEKGVAAEATQDAPKQAHFKDYIKTDKE